MAKIVPFYSLCPLIDKNSVLGLQDLDTDNILVTANCNMIGRYKVNDPKLISSWNSKGTITAAAVYSSFIKSYVAIFNHNEIRIWTASDENIDRVKKYKFTEKLHGLLVSPVDGKVLILFKNGNVSYLENAINNRKHIFEKSIITSEEDICLYDVVVMSDTLVTLLLITKKVDISYRIAGVSPEQFGTTLFNVDINRPDNKVLLGHCLSTDKDCYLISLWSDGKLYHDSLFPSVSEIPSKCITTFSDIDLNQPVIMKMLSPYDIAICGSKQDGILLIIYSIQYDLIQCQEFYQQCSPPPKLWVFNSKLFLIMGHNLVVIPYVQENRKLSMLIGSNFHHVNTTSTEVLPEAEICRNVLSSALEQNDKALIMEMTNSTGDIPDDVIINILLWSLTSQVKEQEMLNNILLNHSVNNIVKLRTLFTVDLAICLLDYIMDNNNNFNIKMMKWASLFLDAFYPQMIISNDKIILNKLKSYLTVLRKENDALNEYKQLTAFLSCIKRKKVILHKPLD